MEIFIYITLAWRTFFIGIDAQVYFFFVKIVIKMLRLHISNPWNFNSCSHFTKAAVGSQSKSFLPIIYVTTLHFFISPFTNPYLNELYSEDKIFENEGMVCRIIIKIFIQTASMNPKLFSFNQLHLSQFLMFSYTQQRGKIPDKFSRKIFIQSYAFSVYRQLVKHSSKS